MTSQTIDSISKLSAPSWLMSWRGGIPEDVARRLRFMAAPGLATTHSGRLYRGALGRANIACRTRTAGSPEPELFLPGLQPILWHPTAPLPQPSTHRASQNTIGKGWCIGDRRWFYCRIRRGKRFLLRISEGNRIGSEHISPHPPLA